MTVYNVNLGIGWASSGVEYAQAYRAQAFRDQGVHAKFIFSDLILTNNIEDLTKNIGFHDDEIIWFYNFFTDVKIAPSDYLLSDFEKDAQVNERGFAKKVMDKEVQYASNKEGLIMIARFHDHDKQTIDQVSYLAKGILVKRDFYSYCKYATEYYTGDRKKNIVSYRVFYNEDGTPAYTQYVKGRQEMFEFPHQHFYYSKNELYAEMLKQLHFKTDDIIIVDRMDDNGILINGQLIFEYRGPAKLMIVVHADHFDPHFTDKHEILWNNFYEYQFTHTDDVDCYVVATDKQRQLLQKQERHYRHADPKIVTIPVGSLQQLKQDHVEKRTHSMITASRLAGEKHVDWLVKATVMAHQQVPDISLDIYGEGAEKNHLASLIKANHADDYIHLKGQHDLTDVYQEYSAYASGSTSEGFGLSLLEAVGSGLPMIGYDVPYGNQTFIDNGKNGYLLPYDEDWDEGKKVQTLAAAMVKLFTKADLAAFEKESYQIAEPYLTKNVAKKWGDLLEELHND